LHDLVILLLPILLCLLSIVFILIAKNIYESYRN